MKSDEKEKKSRSISRKRQPKLRLLVIITAHTTFSPHFICEHIFEGAFGEATETRYSERARPFTIMEARAYKHAMIMYAKLRLDRDLENNRLIKGFCLLFCQPLIGQHL